MRRVFVLRCHHQVVGLSGQTNPFEKSFGVCVWLDFDDGTLHGCTVSTLCKGRDDMHGQCEGNMGLVVMGWGRLYLMSKLGTALLAG